MAERYDSTIFFIERPLNLPYFTVYPIKENEVIDILGAIKLKTSIDFFANGDKRFGI